jgi:hypothetical protein
MICFWASGISQWKKYSKGIYMSSKNEQRRIAKQTKKCKPALFIACLLINNVKLTLLGNALVSYQRLEGKNSRLRLVLFLECLQTLETYQMRCGRHAGKSCKHTEQSWRPPGWSSTEDSQGRKPGAIAGCSLRTSRSCCSARYVMVANNPFMKNRYRIIDRYWKFEIMRGCWR